MYIVAWNDEDNIQRWQIFESPGHAKVVFEEVARQGLDVVLAEVKRVANAPDIHERMPAAATQEQPRKDKE